MKCQDVDRLLSLFIDDMLNEDSRRDIKSHIDSCERCLKELRELETTVNLLGDMPDEELPQGFEERLHSKLIAETTDVRSKNRGKNIVTSVVALAAAIIVAVSIKIGIYDIPMKSMDSHEEAESQADRDIESAPASPIYGERGSEEKQREDTVKGGEEVAKEESDAEIMVGGDEILTEEVLIRVQDVCANSQAIERMAIMYDIEVLETQEDSVVVEIDTEEKRKNLYEELSKLGQIENMGSDENSREVRITISSE